MPTPEQQNLAIILLALLGPKAITWLTNRFVTKADDAEKKALADREAAEKHAAAERDARETAMNLKLDAIVQTLADMKNDAITSRERHAALTAAHAEVKARIDGVSENYSRRIGLLEVDMAALKATRSKR